MQEHWSVCRVYRAKGGLDRRLLAATKQTEPEIALPPSGLQKVG